jgi:hypothetical protein
MAEPKKLSIALLYGSIASVCLVLLVYGTRLGGVQTFLGWTANLRYPILIILATIAALTQKKRNSGYLGFRAALKTCFSIFVLALTIQTLFVWLLMNVIDTHFREAVLEAIPAKITAAYREFGASNEELSRALAEEKGSNQFSFGRMIQGMGFMYVLHFLIAVLIAAIVRRKAPHTGDRA